MLPSPLRRMIPAFFFDRDGTVNISPGAGYVLGWADFHFQPGVREMLHAVKTRGFLAILITSQQGVGKGLMTQETLDEIHGRMQAALGACAFDDILACTGLEGIDPRRKPSPAMIMEAAERHQIDLAASWNVGDSERDVEMGRRAGVGHNLHFGSAEFPDWEAIRSHWLSRGTP